MLTATPGQGSTDGVVAAASHLTDCQAHWDTFAIPVCLSLCICNSAFLRAFTERVTDAAQPQPQCRANELQAYSMPLINGKQTIHQPPQFEDQSSWQIATPPSHPQGPVCPPLEGKDCFAAIPDALNSNTDGLHM